MKQNYFTIGEVSKMIHLPVRTLHYYDEIGLFKPAYVDPATNYRYYSELQLANMDLIKSLKYIDKCHKNIYYYNSVKISRKRILTIS